eukprot:TRINITY_DN7862_c0_g1_i2.p1 TRINITY_DN7862_c0_g1~~TRINITY_DN7862_c0_g1_i2.p1  ORF type:complete len:1743 (+),score=545.20 TRINITY_DN7862_c0_g1_i2:113-5341(+)
MVRYAHEPPPDDELDGEPQSPQSEPGGGAEDVASPQSPYDPFSPLRFAGLDESDAEEEQPAADDEAPGWRRWARELVQHDPRFEAVVFTVILLNCASLAAEDPTDTERSGTPAKIVDATDPIFTALFTCEMAVKMLALGGYFRDWWNCLDFVIVSTGILALAQGGTSFSGLRAFRVLRPLRAVSRSPQIRILVAALLGSVRRLGSVLVLFVAFLLVCAIVAVQLWQGLLRRRCVAGALAAAAEAQSLAAAVLLDRLRADPGVLPALQYDQAYPPSMRGTVCTEGPSALPGGFVCPYGYRCVPLVNPMLGQEHFDNVAAGALALFVSVTLEGWVDTMYRVMDATSSLSALFFVFVVVFGSFFTVNLALVVINSAFERQHEREAAKLRVQRERLRFARRRLRDQRKLRGSRKLSAALAEHLRSVAPASWARRKLRGEDPEFEPGDIAELRTEAGWLDCEVTDADAAGSPASPRDKLDTVGQGMGPVYAVRLCEAQHGEEYEREGVAVHDLRSKPSEPWRRRARAAVRSGAFNALMNAVIVVSTLALAADHHGQPESLDHALWVTNCVATALFAAEMVAKVIGLGVYDYCTDGWNVFDACVVTASLVDVASSGDGSFAAVRSMRILRVFKLSSRFHALHRWMGIILKSLHASAMLSTLILLLMFIYALLGMQLLGNRLCGYDPGCAPAAADDSEGPADAAGEPPRGCQCAPRANFDNVWTAMLTCFQILTGEDWQIVLYQGMAAVGWWAAFFFVSFFVAGNYLLLNLFIAILLNQASQSPDEPEAGEDQDGDKVDTTGDLGLTMASDAKEVPLLEAAPSGGARPDRALCILPLGSPVRSCLVRVVEHTVFELAVVGCILGSTVELALEDPFAAPDSHLATALDTCDVVFTLCFAAEAALKSAAYGAVLGPQSYLRRDAWNRLDFFIVVTSLLSFAAGDHPGGDHLTIFKVFRTLRPLRFISRSEAMRLALMALIRSIPAIANVFVISTLIWAIWGIVAVQWFKGSFYSCSDKAYGDVGGTAEYANRTWDFSLRADCVAYPAADYRWENYSSHFNHIFASILALFEIASLEGWVTVMYLGVDAVSYDEAPRKNHRPLRALFFVCFVVAGAFFIVNLFVSVLLDTYAALKKQSGGERMLLSDAQKEWVASYRSMLRAVQRPAPFLYSAPGQRPPPHVACAQSVVGHRWFEPGVQATILLSVIAITTEYYAEPEWLRATQSALGFVFVGLFTAEAALRVAACGWKGYWDQRWNRFDFLVVILSWPGVIIGVAADTQTDGDLGVVTVFRVLRILRLARMARSAKGVHLLLKTLFLSLPSLFNVVGIVTLIFFVFAVVGMRLFGRVRRGPSMGRYANFETFGNAMLMLLRLCTGGGWQGVMADCRVEAPECDQRLGECGSHPAAVAYFVAFTLCGMYVLLNLFIAVILDSFDEVVLDARKGALSKGDMARFNSVWKVYDPHGTFRIEAAVLPSLLRRIGPPLGVEQGTSWAEATRVVTELDLTVVDGLVDMQPLLQALFCRFSGFPDEISLPSSLVAEVSKKADRRFLAKRRDKTYRRTGKEAVPASAAIGIIQAQALLRGAIARRQVRAFRQGGPYPPCVEEGHGYRSPRSSPPGTPLGSMSGSPRRAAFVLAALSPARRASRRPSGNPLSPGAGGGAVAAPRRRKPPEAAAGGAEVFELTRSTSAAASGEEVFEMSLSSMVVLPPTRSPEASATSPPAHPTAGGRQVSAPPTMPTPGSTPGDPADVAD